MKEVYEDKTPQVPVRVMKGIEVTDIYFVPEILLTLLPREAIDQYRNRVIKATLEGQIGIIKNTAKP